MFDIGFWELTLVGLVSLVVIGPERLPGFVRVTGFWLGKARRTVASVKQEIKEELYAEDLRRTLTKNSPTAEIQDLIDKTSVGFDKAMPVDSIQQSEIDVELKGNPGGSDD